MCGHAVIFISNSIKAGGLAGTYIKHQLFGKHIFTSHHLFSVGRDYISSCLKVSVPSMVGD